MNKTINELNEDCCLAVVKYKKSRNNKDLAMVLKLNSILGSRLRLNNSQ